MPNFSNTVTTNKDTRLWDAWTGLQVSSCQAIVAKNQALPCIVPLRPVKVYTSSTAVTATNISGGVMVVNGVASVIINANTGQTTDIGNISFGWGSQQGSASTNALGWQSNSGNISWSGDTTYTNTQNQLLDSGAASGTIIYKIGSANYNFLYSAAALRGNNYTLLSTELSTANRGTGSLINIPSSSGTLTMTLNTLYIIPVFVSKIGASNTTLNIEVTTIGAASNVIRAMLIPVTTSPWSTSLTDGNYPKVIHTTQATASTATTGVKSISIGASYYGFYYAVVVSQVGTTCVVRASTAINNMGTLGRPGATSSATVYSGLTATNQSGTLVALTSVVPTTGTMPEITLT